MPRKRDAWRIGPSFKKINSSRKKKRFSTAEKLVAKAASIVKNSATWKQNLSLLRIRENATRTLVRRSKTRPVRNVINAWIDNRSAQDYSLAFSTGISKILGVSERPLPKLLALLADKNKQLSLLEDGPGRGVALKSLVDELRKANVTPKVTTVSFRKTPQLQVLKRTGYIERASEMPAEFFLSKQKFDVIISNTASTYHTPAHMQENLILKYASLVKKRGIFVFHVSTNPDLSLNQNAKKRTRIKKLLETKGFKAEIFKDPKNGGFFFAARQTKDQ